MLPGEYLLPSFALSAVRAFIFSEGTREHVTLLHVFVLFHRWDNYPDTFLIDEMLFFLEELEYLDLESVCNQM